MAEEEISIENIIRTNLDSVLIFNYVRTLEQENKELKQKIREKINLQNRIDKAIEYINKCEFNEVLIDIGSEYTYEQDYFKEKILNILEGDSEQ